MKNKLLIIGFVWPEPSSSAAGSRMLQLILFFKARGYLITFASASVENENAYDLSNLDVEKKAIELNDESFDEFVLELQPDLVLFDRFMTEEQYGWRVAHYLPNAIRILDTEDLHFLRKGREAAFKNKEKFNINYVINDISKREIASIYRCDLSLIISTAEMQILQEYFKIHNHLLFYLPFLFDSISEENQSLFPSFNERQNFITIGNFLHPPNFDALRFLKEDIWPIIRKKLPKAEVYNYGAYPSQKVNQLNDNNTGFYVKGRAEDALKVIKNAKVLLAPLRFGAGLKGKLFDAMRTGTPFVTTPIGAEGIMESNQANSNCSLDARELAQLAVKTFQDENYWKKLQVQGFQIINQDFQGSDFETSLSNRLIELQSNLENERQKNFVGAMLMHHTLQSTKYLSKWITAKNA